MIGLSITGIVYMNTHRDEIQAREKEINEKFEKIREDRKSSESSKIRTGNNRSVLYYLIMPPELLKLQLILSSLNNSSME